MKKQYMEVVRKYIVSILIQALALGMLFYDRRLSAGFILFNILYISVDTVMQARKRAVVRRCRRCGRKIKI